MNTDSDSKLLTAIHNNNYEFLYQEIYPKIEKFILGNNGNKQEAEDVFQESIIKIFYKIKNNQIFNKKSISGLIFIISKNIWFNKIKRERKKIELLDIDEYELPNIELNQNEDKIDKILSNMDSCCRQVLFYAIFDKLTMEEISNKMNFKSKDVTKTKNYKCKKKLKNFLKNNPYYLELISNSQ